MIRISWIRGIFYTVWAGLVALIVAVWAVESWTLMQVNIGNLLLALARLSGLLGAFGLIWQLLLVSRASWLERIHGFDVWTRIHRWNGFAAFMLVTGHIPLAISGNSLSGGIPADEQARILLNEWAYVGLAGIGYLLLMATVLLSVTLVRRRVNYETWYFVHVLNYLVLVLVFWHQIEHGLTLAGQDWFRYAWYGLHAGILIHLFMFRFAMPVRLFMKHRFRVKKVVREASDVYSVYVGGRNLHEYQYRAGQFGKWRLLQRGLWTEEHPFTFSGACNGEHVRFTAKGVGDYTRQLPGVRPGVRVMLSQPLGRFTLERARREKLLLIGGGIGITPILAILEAAEPQRDIVVIHAVRTRADLALRDELEELAEMPGRSLYFVLNKEEVPGFETGYLDVGKLQRLVPDADQRSVFLCGPSAMMDGVSAQLLSLGVTRSDIHTERFSL